MWGGGFIRVLICYFRVMKMMRTVQINLSKKEDLKSYRLLLYPIVLFLTILSSWIDNLLKVLGYPDSESIYLTVFTTRSIGLLNALVYGYLRKAYFSSSNPQEELIEVVNRPSSSINQESIERAWREEKP